MGTAKVWRRARALTFSRAKTDPAWLDPQRGTGTRTRDDEDREDDKSHSVATSP